MSATTQQEKFERFKALHARPAVFVMPNPWDAGTSRILTALGFEALATTSAGLAFSMGRRDGERGLSRDETLENARAIVEATHLPVSADLENGFGSSPAACAETIRAASAVGLVGGSIEDATGDASDPIYGFEHAVERVAAASEAARSLPFVLTARAENFLHGRDDLADTIRRLRAYAAAGADVVYAPGLSELDEIRAVCAAVDKPVNVLMGLAGAAFEVAALQKAGVKRISVGGSLERAALGAFMRAAQEIRERGTFTYANDAISHGDATAFMTSTPPQE
jgi:2-methylisocitrate lyase-like PEP mutase family enzyme